MVALLNRKYFPEDILSAVRRVRALELLF